MVIAAGDLAARAPRRAWIRGLDHRIEPQSLGVRDLTRSASAALAARHAGALDAPVEAAALHAAHPHEVVLLREALGLSAARLLEVPEAPPMVAGLARVGAAARAVHEGAGRVVAHATSGPCLQQNLVCVLAAEAAR
jgi:hypothetical protein